LNRDFNAPWTRARKTQRMFVRNSFRSVMLGCMVTLGTWNLENLFRPEEGSGPDSSTEYEKKLDSLAEIITNLGPDVLAVQEVGDPAALEDLAGKLQRTWRTALADPDGRGIRVGFLSRSAVTKVEEIVDFPEGFSPVQINDKGEIIEQMGRLVLKVRVRKDGAMFDIVSVHLKSKLLSYPGGRFSPRDEGERTRYSV
ncbi:endonuclease/exonuclease/phosphatase family protein, partial [Brevibacterium aurantiacum]